MFSIQSYNTHLASIGADIDFSEYVKEVNKESNSNINLDLMDLIEFHNRNECCIPHSYLYTFKLLSTKKGRCLTKDIVTFLQPYNEGIDYTVRHVSIKIGKSILVNDEFYIHPKAFRKMLLKKEKRNDYIDYFLFLEDCMYFYTDYKKKLIESNEIATSSVNINNSFKHIEEMVNSIESKLNVLCEFSPF